MYAAIPEKVTVTGGCLDVVGNPDGADDAGRAQSSGIYLYKVAAEGEVRGGKMALIR